MEQNNHEQQLDEQKKFYANVIGVLRNDLAQMADQKATQIAHLIQTNEKLQMVSNQLNNVQKQNEDLTDALNKVNEELNTLKARYAGPVNRFDPNAAMPEEPREMPREMPREKPLRRQK